MCVNLSAGNFRQCYIGFAHGFCVLSQVAQVEYKCTGFYNAASEVGIIWNDPLLATPWPVRDPVQPRSRQSDARRPNGPASSLRGG